MITFLGFFDVSLPLSYIAFHDEKLKKDEEEKVCWVCLDPIDNEESVAHEGEGYKHPLHKACLSDIAKRVNTLTIPCGVCNKPTLPEENFNKAITTISSNLVHIIAASILGSFCLADHH